MAMPAQPTEWTVEMVRALPDDSNRYEIIDGELFVTPTPSLIHQRAMLSPSTLRTDRGDKRELYQRKGVPEYWIIDIGARRVERWRPNDVSPEMVTGALAWRPDRSTDALVIDLPEYFGRVLGESV